MGLVTSTLVQCGVSFVQYLAFSSAQKLLESSGQLGLVAFAFGLAEILAAHSSLSYLARFANITDLQAGCDAAELGSCECLQQTRQKHSSMFAIRAYLANLPKRQRAMLLHT
jgi:hypothetical protein